MTLLSLGWRHGSQGLPRVSNKHSPRGIPRARVDEDYATNATREKLLARASGSNILVRASDPRGKGELKSSHNSCSRSNDLGGSCSGLGPPWPKAQIKAQSKQTPRGMRTRGSPPTCPTTDCSHARHCPRHMVSPTKGTPARVLLEHSPRRADSVLSDRYRII